MSASAQLVDGELPVRFDRAAVEQARLVREVRARLLQQGVVTYAMLAEGRGISEPAARKWASRAGDRLITVTRDGKVLIPTFQLDTTLDLRDRFGDINARMHRFGMDGWAVWDWWSAPNSWLDADSPLGAADRKDWTAVELAVDGLIQE